MNDLTGAFLIAQEKGEDVVKTQQSFANAGYPISEIEQAILESKQMISTNASKLKEGSSTPKKGFKKILVLIILVILVFFASTSIFLFWDNISNFFRSL